MYEIDDVERLQKRKDKGGSKVRGRREERHLSYTAVVGQVVEQVNKLQGWRFDPYLFLPVCQHVLEQKSKLLFVYLNPGEKLLLWTMTVGDGQKVKNSGI